MLDQNQEIEIKNKVDKFYRLVLFTAFLFFILLLRLVFLQIYQGQTLNRLSNSNRFKTKVLIAPRGLILDRNGKLLVGNKKVSQLIINPHSSFLNEILQKVSIFLAEPIPNLMERIKKKQKRNSFFHPVVLKENLSITQIHHLTQLQWIYPIDVQVLHTEKRFYPLGKNGSQFFGFTGAISQQEVQNLRKQKHSFYLSDIVGKSGLEKLYDKELKGQNGSSMIAVDAQNRLFSKDSSYSFDCLKKTPLQRKKIKFSSDKNLDWLHECYPPIQGKDLHLTLDRDLQEAALKALKRKDSLYPRFGAAFLMKTNGEILAMVSDPSFNPNRFSLGIAEGDWEQLSSQKSKPAKVFINKVYQEHYSPGSVFKPFIALAALQEGLITKETLIDSPATFKLGNRVFHDHNRRGYGKINVVKAIERSSNTFFYQMGHQLGIESIYKYLSYFRFGQRTGIDLPQEIKGEIPDPKTKKIWYKGDTINVSIGQGPVLTTLLQLAVAYNAIATEGLLFKPYLRKTSQTPSRTYQVPKQNILFKLFKLSLQVLKFPFQFTNKNQKLNSNSVQAKKTHFNKNQFLDSLTDGRIKREHFVTIKQALKQVVNGKQGTARGYKLAELSFSGKTGTSQVISLDSKSLYKDCKQFPRNYRHHGWFISFAPSDNPEIVLAVFTEHSCSGSRGSASVARDIIQYYFKNKEASK